MESTPLFHRADTQRHATHGPHFILGMRVLPLRAAHVKRRASRPTGRPVKERRFGAQSFLKEVNDER